MIGLFYCDKLTAEGIAPLQHLTGLTSLNLAYCSSILHYPDFICTLTALKELHLFSSFITTLPAALGNLTNLECLEIEMQLLKRASRIRWKLECVETA
jgi:hypothetical protein